MPLILSGNGAIQTVAGTNAIQIDSNSRVKVPNIPAFAYYGAPGQTATTTNTKFSFNSTNTLDTTGGAYSSANSRFTAQIDGKYYFMAKLNVPSSGNSFQMTFMKNGGGVGQQHTSFISQGYRMDYWAHMLVVLAVNDYVELYVSSNATTGIDNAGQFNGWFIG